jgi:DNA repair protein RadD
MPDEEDLYDLNGDGNRTGERVFSCPRCAMAFAPAPVCPNCGLVIAETSNRPAEPAQRELRQRQSLHLEPARTLSADERQNLYHALLSTARDRNFNDGWAAHRYKERFGVYPPRPWFEAFEKAHA